MEPITVLRMKVFYKITRNMRIFCNFNNLDKTTQKRLLELSKKDVESQCGHDLKAYAIENQLDYDALLEEEALRFLDTFLYMRNV